MTIDLMPPLREAQPFTHSQDKKASEVSVPLLSRVIFHRYLAQTLHVCVPASMYIKCGRNAALLDS